MTLHELADAVEQMPHAPKAYAAIVAAIRECAEWRSRQAPDDMTCAAAMDRTNKALAEVAHA